MTNFLMLLATAIIAFYAYKSHELAKELKKQSEQDKKKYQELMTALITSNVIQCFLQGQTAEGNLTAFNETVSKIKEKLNV